LVEVKWRDLKSLNRWQADSGRWPSPCGPSPPAPVLFALSGKWWGPQGATRCGVLRIRPVPAIRAAGASLRRRSRRSDAEEIPLALPALRPEQLGLFVCLGVWK